MPIFAHFYPLFVLQMAIFEPFFAIFADPCAAEPLEHQYPQANRGCVFRLRLGLLRGAAPPEGLPLRFMPYLDTFHPKYSPITPKLAQMSPNFTQFRPLTPKFGNNMVTCTCGRTKIQEFFEMLHICHKLPFLGGDFGDF